MPTSTTAQIIERVSTSGETTTILINPQLKARIYARLGKKRGLSELVVRLLTEWLSEAENGQSEEVTNQQQQDDFELHLKHIDNEQKRLDKLMNGISKTYTQ